MNRLPVRVRSAIFSYQLCRAYGHGMSQALYRAARMLMTGCTGFYRIH